MELDDAYANAPYIPGAADYPPRWSARASAFRDRLQLAGRAELGLAYGESPRQAIDLFYPETSVQGLFVFVHGGYWLRFDRSYWSHLAEGALARGWAVAIPSYDLCPDVRISDITRQIACAVETSAGRVAGPVSLAGHSAGGHLVARMCVPGILSGDVAARLMRCVPISPVADLRPLLKTSMNSELGLTMAEAEAESPVLLKPMGVSITIWVGGEERPAFLDQAGWLATAWNCEQVLAEGRHHFDVIEALSDPKSAMVDNIVA